MEQQFMLTTFDNPFNPFVDFSSWYMFDCEKDHNTSSRLARIMNIDSEMTQKEIEEERNRAMNLIVEYDLEDTFFKGTEEQIEKWLNYIKNNEGTEETEENAEKSVENTEKQNATVTNA